MENNYMKHPSYGLLQFSRMSGGLTNLFGSSVQHKDTIRLRISKGEVKRDLSTDWYHDDGRIIEVEMSYSQFAEAITSMNMGSGVPVTIRWTEKDGSIPSCDFISKREQFANEFVEKRRKVTENTQQLIEDVTELFNQKKTLTKSDKERILNKLHHINMDIGCNMDFIADMFNEQMDKTIMEAKGEIEAFVQNKINSIAQAALVEQREQFLSLENPVSIQIEDNAKSEE